MSNDDFNLIQSQLSSSQLSEKVKNLIIEYIDLIKNDRQIATDDLYYHRI